MTNRKKIMSLKKERRKNLHREEEEKKNFHPHRVGGNEMTEAPTIK